MSTLAQLSSDERAALARFIAAHASKTGNFRWRSRFTQCARRGSFAPLVRPDDGQALATLYQRHGAVIVCVLRTRDVLLAADQGPPAAGGLHRNCDPLTAAECVERSHIAGEVS
jgi:hypothetical protein